MRRALTAAVALAAALALCPPAVALTLPDGRGWEMVSPVDKNGGDIAPPGPALGEGVAQAAAGGQSVAFPSRTSFGEAAGAPLVSQYVARRTAGGWVTDNVTPPKPAPGPYEADPFLRFSADLSRAVLAIGPDYYEWREGPLTQISAAGEWGTLPPPPYEPRAISSNGRREFFDTQAALVSEDTNNDSDVYEREERGEGSCTKAGGCVFLISSGRAEGGATFVDASADGSDVFFLTDGSLVPQDPGSVDLYDARVGGGFPAPPSPIPCVGDDCQPLPHEPEDPTPGTLRSHAGNPAPRSAKPKRNRHRGKHKHHRKRHRHHGEKGGRR